MLSLCWTDFVQKELVAVMALLGRPYSLLISVLLHCQAQDNDCSLPDGLLYAEKKWKEVSYVTVPKKCRSTENGMSDVSHQLTLKHLNTDCFMDIS